MMNLTVYNVRRNYALGIRDLLNGMRRILRREGAHCSSILNTTDEEYSYSVVISPGRDSLPEDKIIITVTIIESIVRGEEDGGFTFSISATNSNGDIVIQYTPYNYSPQVWARDWESLAYRFDCIVDVLSSLNRQTFFKE